MSSEAQPINRNAPHHSPDPGILFVISSPSGGGKGTLIRRMLKTVPNLSYSVSWTTRQPREGEVNGRDYHFVSHETFEGMRRAGEFLESANVHGNLYGTSHTQIARDVEAGRDIVLEIDVQGAATVRQRAPDAASIFIIPPSFDVLRARLSARGSENPTDLALRLHNARGEVEHYQNFDYVLLNDDADRAAAQLASVVYAERARRARQENLVQRVLRTFPESSSLV